MRAVAVAVVWSLSNITYGVWLSYACLFSPICPLPFSIYSSTGLRFLASYGRDMNALAVLVVARSLLRTKVALFTTFEKINAIQHL